MKKTITLLALLIFGISRSQNVADFESFSLPADSYYKDTNSVDWQTTNASFQYDWTKSSFGDYWSAGFAYTNKNNADSGNYRHQYNCAAGKGYNLSNYYTTGQAGGIIRVKSPDNGVVGFYVTNSTYAYMSMKNGDGFAKKFGDSTSKYTGYPKGSYPDWFKLTVKGYSGGTMKPDSVEFYLADYRFTNNSFDYILKSWQWVDCKKLGSVDSVKFFLNSSDTAGGYGMNNPAFFSIDNFITGQGVGIAERSFIHNINLFPNPTNGIVNINLRSETAFNADIKVYNSIGILLEEKKTEFNSGSDNYALNLSDLSSGMYFIEISDGNKKQNFKLIKN